MKISIDNNGTNINSHYLQSLALLYFPCEVFGKNDNSKRSLSLSLVRDEIRLSGKIAFSDGKETYTRSGERQLSYFVSGTDAEKCFVGEMLLELFEELFSYKSPWGMLTGVRPARFCIDLMRKTPSKRRRER